MPEYTASGNGYWTTEGDHVVFIGELTAADLDAVGAGDYEIIAEFWDRVMTTGNGDVPLHQLGDRTAAGERGQLRRYPRGSVVSLEVQEARRLMKAGAVRPVGPQAHQAAQDARTRYAAAIAARRAN